MKTQKPSLAARALSQLVESWPVYQHGEFISGNLNLAGFNVINHGNFSSVVEGKPGQVIKIFNLKDIGYQHLITYSMDVGDEHLINLFSFTKSGNYGIVELERLAHKTKESVAIAEYIDRCRANPNRIKHRWGIGLKETILSLDSHLKEFNRTNTIKLAWDNHEDNIMFRDSVPVLVDVVFGER